MIIITVRMCRLLEGMKEAGVAVIIRTVYVGHFIACPPNKPHRLVSAICQCTG